MVTNDSHWEAWPFTWLPSCGSATFVTGTLRMHLQDHFMVLNDGSVVARQNANGRAELVDTDGQRYVATQISKFEQVQPPAPDDNTYRVVARTLFRVTALGKGTTELVDVVLTLIGDGTTSHVASVYPTSCPR
jgi:hypothetical protein